MQVGQGTDHAKWTVETEAWELQRSSGTQPYKIFQVSLRDPRASEGILVVSEALCTPRVGSGLFPQESALQAGWLA